MKGGSDNAADANSVRGSANMMARQAQITKNGFAM